MRRFLFTLFWLVLLAGCGNVKTPTPETESDSVVLISPIPSSTPETLSLSLSTATPDVTLAPENVFGDAAPVSAIQDKSKAEPCLFDTIAWISDTQHYANTFPDIYPTITKYISENRERLHLAYVVHTGDLVHNNGDLVNWERASQAMSLLNGIPCGVLAGNHDMAADGGGYNNYGIYFGEDRFNNQFGYGGSFENNRGHYDLVTLGKTDYIFVYMSHAPDKNALTFLVDTFRAYPDRIGILCLHDYMTTDGTLSEAGKNIRKEVVSKCPNCYLVFCGHRYGLYCVADSFDDSGDGVPDRTVYEMMQNYQAAGKEGGSGYFRLMQFDDVTGVIRVKTYSAYLDDYNWLDDPSHNEERYMMDERSEEFELFMPWRD